MVSMTAAGAELFEQSVPTFEKIRKIWIQVNSSERNRIQVQEKALTHKDPLAAGLALLLCGQPAQAAEKLEKADKSLQKFMGLGYAYRQLNRFDEAIDQFERAAKEQAESLTIALEKAQTYRIARDFEKAEKELDSCANFQNVSAEYHYQLAKYLEAVGDYQAAIENCSTAVQLDPAHHEALFALAFSCDLRGDEEVAIDYYKQLLKVRPAHVNALLNLAVLYEDQGEFEKASACVEAVLRSHPNHAKATLFKKDIDSSKIMIYDEEREKRRDRQNKILEIPISDFELSVRSRNCLKKMNILSLGDLLRTTESELLSYKNFGETSLQEIKKILDSKSLRLGMALEEKSAASVDPEAISGASQEVLSKPIEDMELSVRARRALSRLGVKTILELVNKTEAELLGCKNFGVTSLNEIKERLTQFGLSLRILE